MERCFSYWSASVPHNDSNELAVPSEMQSLLEAPPPPYLKRNKSRFDAQTVTVTNTCPRENNEHQVMLLTDLQMPDHSAQRNGITTISLSSMSSDDYWPHEEPAD